MRLLPGYSNYRIVVVRRVTEIIFYQWLVVGQLTAPYKGIGQCTIAHGQVLVAFKYVVDPVQVFAIMDIRNLRTVDIERVHSLTRGDVIPITHYVLFHSSHGKGTTLNKHQSGTGPLLFFTGYLVTSHVLIVVVPTGYVGLLFLFAE